MLIVNHEKLLNLIKFRYTFQDIQEIITFLKSHQTLKFPPLANGLFPAAIVSDETQYTGYCSVWVRDNIHLAYAHYVVGEFQIAKKVVIALMSYFQKYHWRFDEIIAGKVNPSDVMKRPHIRFEGTHFQEIDQVWEHAQNDALGYFVWFYCKLVNVGVLSLETAAIETIGRFVLYFQAIRYWEDEDSGHWEETRKIEASSIGVVVAALRELQKLRITHALELDPASPYPQHGLDRTLIDDLIQAGLDALQHILPAECIQPHQARRYDAALLFLIYPLQIIDGEMADRIVADVQQNLQGDYGIRRYLGDSFWCRDYEELPPEIRTTVSTEREQWLSEQGRALKLGEEAQWCIFDAIISAIFGLKFQQSGHPIDLEQQTRYLNRALGQLTGPDCPHGELKCPELYYLSRDRYIPNDSTPLLWAQANLWVALTTMEHSLLQMNSIN